MVGGATGRRCALLVATGALALPSAAASQTLLPPDNSAVDQYTESYPSAGGDRSTRGDETGEPAQVLGPAKARRLQLRGPAGRETAALVAATAPLPIGPAGELESGGARSSDEGDGTLAGSGGRSNGFPGAGASGLSAVIGQATGFSAGAAPGTLLLLAILAIAIWALAYAWRSNRSGSRP